jgi:acetyl esterase/lipase
MLIASISITVVVLLGFLAWKLTPKGTIAAEILDLIPFWSYLFTRKVDPMEIKRYNYGDHWRQYLLVMQPKEEVISNRKNLILYFHGGSWLLGRPELFKVNAQHWVDKGYTVIMPSYRRIPKFGYTAIREDLNAILRLLPKLLEELHLSEKQIILGGVSAGGNLAAAILYDRVALESCQFDRNRFKAIFLFSAPLQLAAMKKTIVLKSFVGKPFDTMLVKASPISYLQFDETHPILCIHGTADGLVPFSNTISFVDAIRDINPSIIQFQMLPNATHLDTSRWPYRNDKVRKRLMLWLEQMEN